MAKLSRALLTLFGRDGPTNDFGEFGSQAANAPLKTKDPATIQALTAWLTGLKAAINNTSKAPYLEDLNALFYLHSYMSAYMFQEGVPEWEANTNYFTNSIVKKSGTAELYISKTDNNQGNSLPTNSADTAFWKILQQGPPPGSLLDFAGTSAPPGWLMCDGSAVSRTTYANLFAAISTTWGIGDGVTTFNIPDFRRRVAVGSGGGGTADLGNAVGNVGGQEAHVLTTNEMPAHTHNFTDFNVPGGTATIAAGAAAFGTGPTSSAGGGAGHNNIQPSAVVLKIIKI
jgi:microcystin-dependent protein